MKNIYKKIYLLTLYILGCASGHKKSHKNISAILSPDKKKLVFNAYGKDDMDLFILDLTTGNINILSELKGHEISPSFSNNGTKIVFSLVSIDYKKSEIYEIDLKTKKLTTIVNSMHYYDVKPVYGILDDEIYFNRAHRRRQYSGGGYIWDQWDVYKIKNGQLTRITNTLFYQLYAVSLNASGDLLFSAQEAGSKMTHVYSYGSDGHKTIYRDYGYFFSKSQGVNVAAYIKDENKDFNFELFLCNDSENDQKLTKMKSYLTNISISQDGVDILFLSQINRDDRCDLYKIKSDGTGLKKIAASDFFDNPLHGKNYISFSKGLV